MGDPTTLTTGEAFVLNAAARLDRYGMSYVPAIRDCADAESCERRGFFVAIQCVLGDGDGYSLTPETWVDGFDLTDAGRAVLAEDRG